jgi:tRNA modification GTPase
MRGETIFAVSSGVGRAAVAIIRVSGPDAGVALARLAGGLPPPRRAALRHLCRPADGAVLDRALVLWFPGPDSVTGEDVGEFHIHGGVAVLAVMLDTLAADPRLRPAEAGEFTRRGFDNGKLDLTGVEGLADLIAAETEAQRRQALRQYSGALCGLYEDWRARLLAMLAHAEADIDFAEEDIPSDLAAENRRGVAALRAAMAAHLADGRHGERLRDGVSVVVLGAPNAGKSSLVNMLARRDVAIVSAEPGTTRDAIEVRLDLGGYPATVVDTAGLREAAGMVETEGIRRARARAADADLKLILFDATTWPDQDAASHALIDDDAIVVLTKLDLLAPDHPLRTQPPASVEGISVTSGEGLDRFLAALGEAVAVRADVAEKPALTRTRHRVLLEACVGHLDACLAHPDAAPVELAAEDLRLAARALGRLTGRIDVEDVLDSIFREFCIGK